MEYTEKIFLRSNMVSEQLAQSIFSHHHLSAMADSTPSSNSGSIAAPIAAAIEPNHPYHLHPSDSPGMNLISSVFDGRGFPGWRRSMLIALSAKRKLGFINGTCQAPASTASDFSLWSCCNDMVTSWLLNSLSKEIGDSVIYSNIAKELWDSLEQRFGKSNGTKLFHLYILLQNWTYHR